MIKRKRANHTVMNTSCKVKEHMFIWSTCVLIFHFFPSLPFICQGSIHRALLFILLQLRMDHQDICRVVPGHQFHDLSQSTSLGFTFGKLWDGMLQRGQPQHGYRVASYTSQAVGSPVTDEIFWKGGKFGLLICTRLGDEKMGITGLGVESMWICLHRIPTKRFCRWERSDLNT